MKVIRKIWIFVIILVLSLTSLSLGVYGASGELFRKVAELREFSAKVRKAVLLPDGRAAYYWELTRPPTEEEKNMRAAWFDAEWEKFRQQAEQEGIPEIEKSAKEMEQKLKEEIAKQPPVVRRLSPFFSGVFKGLPGWLRWVVKYSYSIARRHFIGQPVVVEAGIRIWDPNGKTTELLPVDVPALYGEESWARFPAEEVHLRASPDGRYIAFETVDKEFILFELTELGLSPKAKVLGYSPLGWSPDGKFLFLTRSVNKKGVIAIYSTDDLQEVAQCPADFERALIKNASVRGSVIMDITMAEDRLAVALLTDLGIFRLLDGSMILPDAATIRKIGAPRGLAFSLDGSLLYIASLRGFTIVNSENFAILDQYIRQATDDFYFQRLVGVSPDGRYAAVLHGQERDYGWATLFIWDIHKRRVVQRIGTQPGRMLDTISSGFRFIYPPAQLTHDWQYLLVVRQDGVLELYQNTTRK